MRDLCLDSCRTPDGGADGDEWERLILLHCGYKMGDIIVDCLNGKYTAIDFIYVFIKRMDNILRKILSPSFQ